MSITGLFFYWNIQVLSSVQYPQLFCDLCFLSCIPILFDTSDHELRKHPISLFFKQLNSLFHTLIYSPVPHHVALKKGIVIFGSLIEVCFNVELERKTTCMYLAIMVLDMYELNLFLIR